MSQLPTLGEALRASDVYFSNSNDDGMGPVTPPKNKLLLMAFYGDDLLRHVVTRKLEACSTTGGRLIDLKELSLARDCCVANVTAANYVRWCLEEHPTLLDDDGADLGIWEESPDHDLSSVFEAVLWTVHLRDGDVELEVDTFLSWVMSCELVVRQVLQLQPLPAPPKREPREPQPAPLSWQRAPTYYAEVSVDEKLGELLSAHKFGMWKGIGEPQHATLCGRYTGRTWHGSRCEDCSAMLVFRKAHNHTECFVLGLDSCPRAAPASWKPRYLDHLESGKAWDTLGERGISDVLLREWLELPPPERSICTLCRSPLVEEECTNKYPCKQGTCTNKYKCKKIWYHPCTSCRSTANLRWD